MMNPASAKAVASGSKKCRESAYLIRFCYLTLALP